MRLQVVIGVRPQFIKAAPFLRELEAREVEYELVHTGQHYDYEMSQVFFDEIGLPKPHAILDTGSGLQGEQTAKILTALESRMIENKPDCVVVFGDTNSTLAGALAASKLGIRIAHIEAGVRSYNRRMPEEINRVIADAISNLKLCPSDVAIRNLKAEGIVEGVFNVGDVMADAIRLFGPIAKDKSAILDTLSIQEEFRILTLHRAENVDDSRRLDSIFEGIAQLDGLVLFPVHPRTKKRIAEMRLELPENIRTVDPIGYLDFLKLQMSSRAILTDSGGLQKEAYWNGVPCVTLRDETEWVETVEVGWNRIVGVDPAAIAEAAIAPRPEGVQPELYGDGNACAYCIDRIADDLTHSRNE